MATNGTKSIFFSHDADASNDVKIAHIESIYGLGAYAIYFKILELLTITPGYKLNYDDNTFKMLAYKFHTEEEFVRKVVDLCLHESVQLFTKTVHEFYSCSHIKRMEYKDEKSKINSRNAKQRYSNNLQIQNSQCERKANAEQKQEIRTTNINENINLNNTSKDVLYIDNDKISSLKLTPENFKRLLKITKIAESELLVKIESFNNVRKTYNGTKRGIYDEFKTFHKVCKAQGLSLDSELHLLTENTKSYLDTYSQREKKYRPHFSTFLNNRTYQEPETQETLPAKQTDKDNMTVQEWKRLNKTEFDTIVYNLNQMCLKLSDGEIKESDIPKFDNPNYPKSVNEYFQNEVYKYIESAKELASIEFGNSNY